MAAMDAEGGWLSDVAVFGLLPDCEQFLIGSGLTDGWELTVLTTMKEGFNET